MKINFGRSIQNFKSAIVRYLSVHLKIMKKPLTAIFVVFILLAPGIAPLLAQTGGQPGAFSRMGFSPRGMAMGNAMSAVHQEGSYAYYNPAMAAIPSDFIQADISSAALQFDRRLHMVTGHFQLPPMAGFSISLINARVGNIDGRSQSGYHTETLFTAEYQILGNFALRFKESIWAGIGIKYNLANYHTDIPTSSSIGLDLGVLAKFSSKLTGALAVKDLLSKNDIDTSSLYGTDTSTDRAQAYPVRILAGITYEILDSWLFSFDFEHRVQQLKQTETTVEEVNGFEQSRITRNDIHFSSQYLRAGTRYELHERITVRTGIQFQDIGEDIRILPSGGFSIHLPFDLLSPSIDYAFMREPNQISNMHVFSLRLNI
jgi:hypothetical protein